MRSKDWAITLRNRLSNLSSSKNMRHGSHNCRRHGVMVDHLNWAGVKQMASEAAELHLRDSDIPSDWELSWQRFERQIPEMCR